MAHKEFKDNLGFKKIKVLPMCKKKNKILGFSTMVLRGKDNGILK